VYVQASFQLTGGVNAMQCVTSSAACDAAVPSKLEILSINHDSRTCAALRSIVSRTNWVLHCVPDLAGAISFLEERFVPVVVCARDFDGASWLEVIDAVRRFPNPPEVLVYSDNMDAAFGLKVLDAGGFDVLTTPFESEQVLRSISLACRKWKDAAHTLKHYRHAASAA
jgi:DNA-binding response OmpR family regulator